MEQTKLCQVSFLTVNISNMQNNLNFHDANAHHSRLLLPRSLRSPNFNCDGYWRSYGNVAEEFLNGHNHIIFKVIIYLVPAFDIFLCALL